MADIHIRILRMAAFTLKAKSLPLNWHCNLLGIALCTVVAFKNCDVYRDSWISCECSLKRNNGISHKFSWLMSRNRMMASKTRGVANSDHMFLLYDHSIFEDFIKKQANFLSSTCNATFSFHSICGCSYVTKCGISLLYAQDAERLGILSQDVMEPQVEHNITKRSRDEFEAGGGVIVISSDEEEEDNQPNPKRI
ncbi:disease resistance-like protein CSA1 [Ziziphus jujuba]|uniref:Disease resistance-like protein CSA1 n=1 Tax=Ziziphus jujuba TaxID=326968 RepID=A0ABM3ZUI1_ZIZJJ|nr:disease resistance-like protein CSA1 [Ziziphus jujuba]